MKKFLIVLISLLCFAGCNQQPAKDDKGRDVYKVNVYYNAGILEYMIFDEHEYVLWRNGNRGGICHSPKCKCLEKRR